MVSEDVGGVFRVLRVVLHSPTHSSTSRVRSSLIRLRSRRPKPPPLRPLNLSPEKAQRQFKPITNPNRLSMPPLKTHSSASQHRTQPPPSTPSLPSSPSSPSQPQNTQSTNSNPQSRSRTKPRNPSTPSPHPPRSPPRPTSRSPARTSSPTTAKTPKSCRLAR